MATRGGGGGGGGVKGWGCALVILWTGEKIEARRSRGDGVSSVRQRNPGVMLMSAVCEQPSLTALTNLW